MDSHSELLDTVEGRPGQWMQTFTGKKFFPLDPRPGDICIEDIANGLATIRRYGGHLPPETHYSVAEHSVLMYNWGKSQGQFMTALVALFHDAAEAYTGDLPRAMKDAIGPSWRSVEAAIERAIWKALNIPAYLVEDAMPLVKEWDQRMIATEKPLMRVQIQEWAHDVLEPLPLEILALPAPLAKEFFLGAVQDANYHLGGWWNV